MTRGGKNRRDRRMKKRKMMVVMKEGQKSGMDILERKSR